MAAGVAVAWLSPAVTVDTPTSLDVNATATYTATADPEQAERLQLVEFTFPKNTDLSAATLTVQQDATILPPPITTNTTLTATSILYGATYHLELANEANPPSVVITLSGVGNPSQPGSYQYSVSTLSSIGTISGQHTYELAAVNASPSAGAVTLSDPLRGAPSAYSVALSVGPQGRLASDAAAGPIGSTSTSRLRWRCLRPRAAADTAVNGVPLSTDPIVSGQRVTIQIPDGLDIPSGGSATVEFASPFGIVNPPTAGSYNLQVSTSAEAGIVTSEAFTINDPPDTATHHDPARKSCGGRRRPAGTW